MKWECKLSRNTIENAAVAAMRPKVAAQYMGMGESTLWRRAKVDPEFPKPIKTGPRMTVFLRSEMDEYIASRRRTI